MTVHQSPRAEISKSRSKKNPFKVRVFAANGEILLTSELLTTRRNCIKNLLASLKAFNGASVVVCDKTGKQEKHFSLYPDGLEESMQVRG